MDLTITYAYDDAPFEILNDNFTSIIDRKYSMIIAVLAKKYNEETEL